MRKILLAAIATVIIFSACEKRDSSCGNNDSVNKYSTAVITGRDFTKCYCCGGWIIEIDNLTYKFDRAPVGSTVNLETLSYPASVNVTWHSLPGNCSQKIEIVSLTQ
jgi:hypothetical protein